MIYNPLQPITTHYNPITMTITMIYNDLQPTGITIQLQSITMTVIMIYNDLQPITIQLQ